jgi:hypothetical protein
MAAVDDNDTLDAVLLLISSTKDSEAPGMKFIGSPSNLLSNLVVSSGDVLSVVGGGRLHHGVTAHSFACGGGNGVVLDG